MYMTDTLCSFTRNVIFKSCFLLSEYGSSNLRRDHVTRHIHAGIVIPGELIWAVINAIIISFIDQHTQTVFVVYRGGMTSMENWRCHGGARGGGVPLWFSFSVFLFACQVSGQSWTLIIIIPYPIMIILRQNFRAGEASRHFATPITKHPGAAPG